MINQTELNSKVNITNIEKIESDDENDHNDILREKEVLDKH